MDEDTTSRWHSPLMSSVGGSRKRALELGNPGLCCLRSFLFPRFLLSSPGSQKWEEAMGGLWHLPQLELHHRCLSLTVVLWCVCLCVCMCAHARASYQQYCLIFTFAFPDLENSKFLVYVDQLAISISYNYYHSLVDVNWRILSCSIS